MTIRMLFSLRSKPPGSCAGIASCLLPFALGLVLTGCLSRPSLVQRTFALQIPRPPHSAATQSAAVLAVRAVEVSPLFEGRDFVYRLGPGEYAVDPYAAFLVSPSYTLAIALRGGLSASGTFKDVVEPDSQLRADIDLEIHVTELYGDLRKEVQPAAVLSMRMLFFETQTGKARQPLFEKEYTRRVPLPKKTPAAIVAGWDQALSAIVGEVASDFTATQAARPTAK